MLPGLSLAGGFSKASAQRSVLYIVIAIILGVGVSYFLVNVVNLRNVLLPFATGVLLYVSIGHLLPIALKKRGGLFVVLLGAGMIFMSAHFFGHTHY